MALRDTKYVSMCCLCGIAAAGATFYLYNRIRRKTHIEYGEKTSKTGCEVTELPSFTTSEDSSEISDKVVVEEDTSIDSSESYHSFSTVSSSSSSLVTCSSSNYFTETSDDDRDKYRKNNFICGVYIENESYHDEETPKEFELQLSSPIVATPTNIQQEFESEDTPLSIVPDYYSDSSRTLLENMGVYNKINQPNSPHTAWYVK